MFLLPTITFLSRGSEQRKIQQCTEIETEDRRKILGKMNDKHFQNIIITPREIAARIFSRFCP